MLRRLAPLALLIALAVGGAGCAADPVVSEPSPRFTTDADAFAAAEETYRAYVDALNQVDLSDPETFEAVYAWTTGDANASSRKTFSQMHADRWTVSGATAIQLIEESLQASGSTKSSWQPAPMSPLWRSRTPPAHPSSAHRAATCRA